MGEQFFRPVTAARPVFHKLAGEFRGGTPESIKQATWKVMEACCKYPNFVISSGCDIPPMSPWENIDAFFAAVDAFYQK